MTSPLKDSTAAPLPLPPQALTAVPVDALTARAVVSLCTHGRTRPNPPIPTAIRGA